MANDPLNNPDQSIGSDGTPPALPPSKLSPGTPPAASTAPAGPTPLTVQPWMPQTTQQSLASNDAQRAELDRQQNLLLYGGTASNPNPAPAADPRRVAWGQARMLGRIDAHPLHTYDLSGNDIGLQPQGRTFQPANVPTADQRLNDAFTPQATAMYGKSWAELNPTERRSVLTGAPIMPVPDGMTRAGNAGAIKQIGDVKVLTSPYGSGYATQSIPGATYSSVTTPNGVTDTAHLPLTLSSSRPDTTASALGANWGNPTALNSPPSATTPTSLTQSGTAPSPFVPAWLNSKPIPTPLLSANVTRGVQSAAAPVATNTPAIPRDITGAPLQYPGGWFQNTMESVAQPMNRAIKQPFVEGAPENTGNWFNDTMNTAANFWLRRKPVLLPPKNKR
jgi:hypothetical protein